MKASTPVTEFTPTEVASDDQSALLFPLRFLRGDLTLQGGREVRLVRMPCDRLSHGLLRNLSTAWPILRSVARFW